MNSFTLNQFSYISMFNGGINQGGNIFSNRKNYLTPGISGAFFTPQIQLSNPIFRSSRSFVDPSYLNSNPIGMNIFAGNTNILTNTSTSKNIFGKSIHRKKHTGKTESSPTKTSSVSQIKRPQSTTSNQATRKVDLRNDFLTTSNRYMGYNEADGSSRVISNSGEWCADFIKFVINKTYREKGLIPPTRDLKIEPDMPHLRVENIKQWGIDNGTYLSVANKSNKANIIKQNVKPGDVIILRENGASHTGFVTKVYADGSFDSIEGNRNDRVMNAHYKANDKSLSGFVQVQS